MDILLIVVAIAIVGYGGYRIKKLIDDNGELSSQISNLRQQLRRRDSQLREFQTYASKTKIIEYQYIDVLMFGPRESGKTSISELWTSPWTQISDIGATHSWRQYEANIYEFDEERRKDALFETDRVHKPVLRVRIHDYPGENEYRLQAIKDLRDLGKAAVVVFIFRIEYGRGAIQYERDNAEYFSRSYIEEIEEHIPLISGAVSKAFVVFNKVDLLPPEWSTDESIARLKEKNADALYHIEKTFSGRIEYHLTSARTNRGIIGLLGAIGRVGVEDTHQEEYDSIIRTLEREFETQGI